MAVWRGPRGIEVEAISIGRRPRLRVTQVIGRDRYLLAYCRTVREVAQHVDLADLVELIIFPGPSSDVAGASS